MDLKDLLGPDAWPERGSPNYEATMEKYFNIVNSYPTQEEWLAKKRAESDQKKRDFFNGFVPVFQYMAGSKSMMEKLMNDAKNVSSGEEEFMIGMIDAHGDGALYDDLSDDDDSEMDKADQARLDEFFEKNRTVIRVETVAVCDEILGDVHPFEQEFAQRGGSVYECEPFGCIEDDEDFFNGGDGHDDRDYFTDDDGSGGQLDEDADVKEDKGDLGEDGGFGDRLRNGELEPAGHKEDDDDFFSGRFGCLGCDVLSCADGAHEVAEEEDDTGEQEDLKIVEDLDCSLFDARIKALEGLTGSSDMIGCFSVEASTAFSMSGGIDNDCDVNNQFGVGERCAVDIRTCELLDVDCIISDSRFKALEGLTESVVSGIVDDVAVESDCEPSCTYGSGSQFCEAESYGNDDDDEDFFREQDEDDDDPSFWEYFNEVAERDTSLFLKEQKRGSGQVLMNEYVSQVCADVTLGDERGKKDVVGFFETDMSSFDSGIKAFEGLTRDDPAGMADRAFHPGMSSGSDETSDDDEIPDLLSDDCVIYGSRFKALEGLTEYTNLLKSRGIVHVVESEFSDFVTYEPAHEYDECDVVDRDGVGVGVSLAKLVGLTVDTFPGKESTNRDLEDVLHDGVHYMLDDFDLGKGKMALFESSYVGGEHMNDLCYDLVHGSRLNTVYELLRRIYTGGLLVDVARIGDILHVPIIGLGACEFVVGTVIKCVGFSGKILFLLFGKRGSSMTGPVKGLADGLYFILMEIGTYVSRFHGILLDCLGFEKGLDDDGVDEVVETCYR